MPTHTSSHAEPSLHEVAQGIFAYLQPGGWGYSNAGLITGAGGAGGAGQSGQPDSALLVDTLYDGTLTARMLQTLHLRTSSVIDTVVNTHANGDHCWGNAQPAIAGARIVSSRHAAREMLELSPKLMHTLVRAARVLNKLSGARALLGLVGKLGVRQAAALVEAAPFISEHFGTFDFGAVDLRLPDTTFDARLTLAVAGRPVELTELGPAHTRGDVIAYVPDARVVFTGDLLFSGSHPIAWEGPVEGWIAACDHILSLDVDTVVPGHGPISSKREIQATKQYWLDLLAHTKRALAAGLDYEEAARAIAAEQKLDWREQSRIVVNVHTIMRGLRGETHGTHPLLLLAAMSRYENTAGVVAL